MWFRQIYAQGCKRLARPVLKADDGVVTLTNSNWTKTIAETRLGVQVSGVVYPACVPPPLRPDLARDPYLFVALGRIAPGKRLDEAVEIIERLRAREIPARLHIVGRADSPYARRFLRRHKGKDFLQLSPNATPNQISAALARATFGLHCYRFEHFGIAVGEMIAAGCLPLVFDGGGVCELVPDATLRFATPEEAVTRAEALIATAPTMLAARQKALASSKALGAACNFDVELAQMLRLLLPDAQSCAA